MSSKKACIEVKNLSKCFQIYNKPSDRLKQFIIPKLPIIGKKYNCFYKEFWALKNISVEIKEGEMFLLPPNTPHNPGRPTNTVGLVIERKRKGTELKDGLMWFCDNCNHKLHDTYFELENVEKDFQPRFKNFYNSLELRTCSNCGHVMDVDPRFVD